MNATVAALFVDRAGPIAPDSEQWMPVVGFEGFYEVSSHGCVRSLDRTVLRLGAPKRLSGRVLKQKRNSAGYLLVGLYRGDAKQVIERVHRLVAFAFIGSPPSSLHEIAHGDGTRDNNKAENLRWATRMENAADRVLHGTHGRGEQSTHAKLSAADVLSIRKRFRKYASSRGGESGADLAREFGVSDGTIRCIASGKAWRHL